MSIYSTNKCAFSGSSQTEIIFPTRRSSYAISGTSDFLATGSAALPLPPFCCCCCLGFYCYLGFFSCTTFSCAGFASYLVSSCDTDGFPSTAAFTSAITFLTSLPISYSPPAASFFFNFASAVAFAFSKRFSSALLSGAWLSAEGKVVSHWTSRT